MQDPPGPPRRRLKAPVPTLGAGTYPAPSTPRAQYIYLICTVLGDTNPGTVSWLAAGDPPQDPTERRCAISPRSLTQSGCHRRPFPRGLYPASHRGMTVGYSILSGRPGPSGRFQGVPPWSPYRASGRSFLRAVLGPAKCYWVGFVRCPPPVSPRPYRSASVASSANRSCMLSGASAAARATNSPVIPPPHRSFAGGSVDWRNPWGRRLHCWRTSRA